MAKPKSTGPRFILLSRAVKRTLLRYGGHPSEHLFVTPVISDYLLEKLLLKDPNLPPGKLGQAKRLAEHNTVLGEAISFAEKKWPISTANARKIIQITLNEMPKYLERNKDKLSEEQVAGLGSMQQKLTEELKKAEELPTDRLARLPIDFLKIANAVHLDELRNLLGEKKFRVYAKALDRVMKLVRERKKKPNTQKG